MKKLIVLVLFMFLAIAVFAGVNFTNVYAEELELYPIVQKLNQNIAKTDNPLNGMGVNASTNSNSILVTYVDGSNVQMYAWYNSDGVLTSSFPSDDELYQKILKQMLIAIGELQGYEYDYMDNILMLSEIYEYTVEEEGFSIGISGTDLVCNISMDHMNLTVNLDDLYFTYEDLIDSEEDLTSGPALIREKGNVYFLRVPSGTEIVYSIVQKNDGNDLIYKSLLSIIQVMFGSDTTVEFEQMFYDNYTTDSPVDYFKSIYPSFEDGDYEVDGLKIEVNPTKNEYEPDYIPDTYQFVRFSVDQGLYMSMVEEYVDSLNQPEEPTDPEDPTDPENPTDPNDNGEGEYNGNLPDTGDKMVSTSMKILTLFSMLSVIIYIKYTSAKGKITNNI